VDSDYVFINIWAQPEGQAWSYPAAYDFVMRLRAKTGLDFDPHWFRHSYGTELASAGIDLLALRELMGHTNPETTAAYVHLSPETLAAEYARARAAAR
jgi:site-specific recombinase XerD